MRRLTSVDRATGGTYYVTPAATCPGPLQCQAHVLMGYWQDYLPARGSGNAAVISTSRLVTVRLAAGSCQHCDCLSQGSSSSH